MPSSFAHEILAFAQETAETATPERSATTVASAGLAAKEDLFPARLLLVDDQPANLLALECVLERLGEPMVRALSGEEALKKVLQRPFALILMDVHMPGMDGLETASYIKQLESCRHVPIIFLTAERRRDVEMFAGYAQGGVDYLLKPFDPDILRSKVAVFVELHKARERLRRREAELREREREALERRSERRFQTLVDSMSQFIWASTADGRIYYCNRVWQDSSGLGVAQTDQMGFLRVVHPDDHEPVRRIFRETLAATLPSEVRFRLGVRPTGAYRWHLCRMTPERDEDDDLCGWIVTTTDIESQVQAELCEREARRAAESANAAKDQFLGTVSRGLGGPLASVQSWVQILRASGFEPAQVARALDGIEQQCREQARLIEDLVDLSRIMLGRLTLSQHSVSLGTVASAIVDALRPSADARRVELVLVVAPPEKVDLISGDPERLRQVIRHLVLNAIKFTLGGGTVEVSVDVDDEDVLLSVSDTGVGIPASFQPHLFERFRQADDAQGGLGVGLVITRHLVEMQGGRIEVESQQGQGTVFTVRLPRVARVEEAAAARSPADPIDD